MIRHIILLFLLFAAYAGIYAQNAATQTVFYEVDAPYIDSCELGRNCPPIIIKRASIQQEVIVSFPIGGTQTDVYLYASKSNGLKTEPIRHDRRFIQQGKPVLNLTGLADGEYPCSLMACSLGGPFTLMLQTDEK